MVPHFRILRGCYRVVCLCRPDANSLAPLFTFLTTSQLGGKRMHCRVRARLAVAFAAWKSFNLQSSDHLGPGLVACRAVLRSSLATNRSRRLDAFIVGILSMRRRSFTLQSDLRHAFHPHRTASCATGGTRKAND